MHQGDDDHADASSINEAEAEHLVFFSVFGIRRWDEHARRAVAHALRENALTTGERIGLANLIDGTHPEGHHLKMMGQGNGLLIIEKANAFARMMAVGKSIDKKISHGETREAAIFDAAEAFGVSEATVRRDWYLYKFHFIDHPQEVG